MLCVCVIFLSTNEAFLSNKKEASSFFSFGVSPKNETSLLFASVFFLLGTSLLHTQNDDDDDDVVVVLSCIFLSAL